MAESVELGGHRRLHTSKLFWGLPIILLVIAIASVWLYNQITLQKPLERVLIQDPRNHVVHADVHYETWIDTSSIVFDLNELSGNASNLDILRVFAQYAQAMQTHKFTQVVLSSNGQRKFIIPGEYFQTLGREYDQQNPVYTIRTFAHHVLALDGSQPFPEVEGGLFFVVPRELEQFKEFCQRWFLADYLARHK